MAIYLILGALAVLGAIWFLRQVSNDPMSRDGLAKAITYVLIGSLILIAHVWRWRLRVEPRGVWLRTLFWWRFGAWESPALDPDSGVETGKTAPIRRLLSGLGIEPGKTPPFRRMFSNHLAGLMIRIEDFYRMMEFYSDFVPPPPPPPLPDPAAEIAIKSRNGRRIIHVDDDGLIYQEKWRPDEYLSWDEIDSVELIIRNHHDPELSVIRVTGASRTIEIRYREERPDGSSAIATLRHYLPDGSLDVTTILGRPRDIHEARRRAKYELRELRRSQKQRRSTSRVLFVLILLFVGTKLPAAWKGNSTFEAVLLSGGLLVLASPFLILIGAAYCRSDPRRGMSYRAYQRYKAQNV